MKAITFVVANFSPSIHLYLNVVKQFFLFENSRRSVVRSENSDFLNLPMKTCQHEKALIIKNDDKHQHSIILSLLLPKRHKYYLH